MVVGGQVVLEAFHPRFERRLALGADIDRAGGIFADQHHRQAGRTAGGGAEARDLGGDRFAKRQRGRLAVDPLGAHPPR